MAADIPRTFRPLGSRVMSAALSVLLVGMVVFLWLQLPSSAQDEFDWVSRVSIIVACCLIVVALYAVFRTSARAELTGLTVVNGYRRRRFEWAQVVAVTLSPNKAFAVLDLSDGSTVSLMALQTADGSRARRLTRDLAAVIERQSGVHDD